VSYEIRNNLDFQFGTITAAIATSDTVLQSAEFTSLPTHFSTGTYLPIVLLNPATRLHEKCWLVSHTASSASGTFVRGRETTIAQSWPVGTQWVSGPTIRDTMMPTSSSALALDPHVGLRAMIADKVEVWEYTYAQGWLGAVRAQAADMGRAQDATITHPNARVPQMKMWTATGTTSATGILATTIPNGGFNTRLISVVATRYGSVAAYVPTVESTSTITTINILASNTGTGAVASTAISVGIMAIGY
jgi:hypothetical protein